MITVLIADDEPHIVSLVRVTLEDEHVRIVEASDGLRAVEVAEAEHPDILLLDVHMPVLDGFNVCRRLRQDNRLTRAKIIMLTAAAQATDEARGFAAGADHYLTKPFSPVRLLALVQSLAPGSIAWLPR